ncbi:MAG: hypothetical protein JWM61_1396 [Micrococcaceae bacterium]|jgi:hypothetical protein|nr:hypothetical protein [Micrococcaceae bacterium]
MTGQDTDRTAGDSTEGTGIAQQGRMTLWTVRTLWA